MKNDSFFVLLNGEKGSEAKTLPSYNYTSQESSIANTNENSKKFYDILKQNLEIKLYNSTQNHYCYQSYIKMRKLIPLNISQLNTLMLTNLGLPNALAFRIWDVKALWLIVMHREEILKIRISDLRSKYNYQSLDLIELRALYFNLPCWKESSPESEWKKSVKKVLEEYSKTELNGSLNESSNRNKAYEGCEQLSLFDPHISLTSEHGNLKYEKTISLLNTVDNLKISDNLSTSSISLSSFLRRIDSGSSIDLNDLNHIMDCAISEEMKYNKDLTDNDNYDFIDLEIDDHSLDDSFIGSIEKLNLESDNHVNKNQIIYVKINNDTDVDSYIKSIDSIYRRSTYKSFVQLQSNSTKIIKNNEEYFSDFFASLELRDTKLLLEIFENSNQVVISQDICNFDSNFSSNEDFSQLSDYVFNDIYFNEDDNHNDNDNDVSIDSNTDVSSRTRILSAIDFMESVDDLLFTNYSFEDNEEINPQIMDISNVKNDQLPNTQEIFEYLKHNIDYLYEIVNNKNEFSTIFDRLLGPQAASKLLLKFAHNPYSFSDPPRVLSLLIDTLHADVNSQDKDGKTALTLFFNNPELGIYLMERGADIFIEDSQGVSPILISMEYGETWMLTEFQKLGGEENIIEHNEKLFNYVIALLYGGFPSRAMRFISADPEDSGPGFIQLNEEMAAELLIKIKKGDCSHMHDPQGTFDLLDCLANNKNEN